MSCDRGRVHLAPWGRRLPAVGGSLLACAFTVDCSGCAGHTSGAESPDGTVTTTASATASTTTTSGAVQGPNCSDFDGWTPLAGVSSACPICVPASPDVVSPLVWASCTDGTPGCEELLVDWTAPDGLGLFYMTFAGAVTDLGAVVVVGRRFGGDLSGWLEMVVGRPDGSVLGAIRGRNLFEPKACAPVIAAVGSGHVIAGIADYATGPSYQEYQVELPLDAGTPHTFNILTPEVLHGNVTGSRSPGNLFASTSFTPAAEILKVPYDGTAPSVIAQFSTDHAWEPGLPLAVGPDVLFWALSTENRGTAQIYHTATGATETYLDIPGTDIVAIRTDGATAVWIQASPPYYLGGEVPNTVELWSSPYSASPAALLPTKVADLDRALWNSLLTFQSGIVVLRSSLWIPPSDDVSWSRDIALRLNDKVYWTVDAPVGAWWGDTMYADVDEVAMPVQPAGNEPETFTVRRQRLSALGPPTAVSGLLGTP
jgi:hypothetical protein